MNFIIQNFWLIIFVLWGIPLSWFRSKFRKMVYQTDHWTINIKPIFMKEIRALLGNIYPGNNKYLKARNNYRIYLAVYFLLFVLYLNFRTEASELSGEKTETISVGSKIPVFQLKDQNGNSFDIRTVLGKKNLVVYFYPKDDSPGCTKEACSFRDQFEIFAEADAVIIGISAQSVESHREFAAKYKLNYTLLSDDGNTVRKLFGVPANFLGLIPGRVTYVVDKAGVVIYLFNSQVNAEQHVSEALKILKKLK